MRELTIVIPNTEEQKQPEESELQYQDRLNLLSLKKLQDKKRLNKQEEEKCKALQEKLGTAIMLKDGEIPVFFADKDLKKFASRIHVELASQYGSETPVKRMLLDRITSAWIMAFSYERTFTLAKYKENDEGSYTWNCSHERTAYLREARKGIESANDQMLRLIQVLQNLVSPPIQVIAKNAIVAQNMQINQGTAAKDFDKKTPGSNNPENNAKTPA